MNASHSQKFLPLKPQWFHILLSLAGGEQHGYAIMQEVLERTAGKVRLWPATLYGSLKRLIEAELIEESDERPAPELDDARRRYLPAHGLWTERARRGVRPPAGIGPRHSDKASHGHGVNFAW